MNYKPRKVLSNKTGRRIAVGDIHGCYWTLKKLFEEKIKITSDDQIFLLGDLIDRGHNSKLVLDYILRLKSKNYEIHPLRGNHEEMLLMAYSNGIAFFEEYLEKYNSTDLLDGDVEMYLDFIAQFEYCFELENHILSHPGINRRNINPFTDLRGMFAKVDFELDIETIFSKKQVHGHTIKTTKEIERNILNNELRVSIDSGCYLKDQEFGVLTGLELDTMELYYQRNVE